MLFGVKKVEVALFQKLGFEQRAAEAAVFACGIYAILFTLGILVRVVYNSTIINRNGGGNGTILPLQSTIKERLQSLGLYNNIRLYEQ